jgi:ATP-binding cassette subfamily B protein
MSRAGRSPGRGRRGNGTQVGRALRSCLSLVFGCVRWHSLLALTASVALCAAPALNVALVALAVNRVAAATADASPDAVRAAVAAVLLLLGVLLGGHALGVISNYALGVVQLKVEHVTGQAIVDKTATLELVQFEDPAVQNALHLARAGASARLFLLFSQLNSVLTGLLSLLGLSAVLLSWNPLVGLCILISPAPAIIASAVYGKIGWKLDQEHSENRRRIAYLPGLLSDPRTAQEVLAFDAGGFLARRHLRISQQILGVDLSLNRRRTLATGALGLASVLGIGIAFLSATYATIGAGDVGTFAGFLTGATTVQASAQSVFASIGGVFENGLYVRNIDDFLRLPPPAPPSGEKAGGEDGDEAYKGSGGRAGRRAPSPSLELVAAGYRYPGAGNDSVQEITLSVGPGETLYLVGPNGSGKSTVAKLACGLYPPTSGLVRIGGRATGGPDRARRAAMVAMMFQDSLRFEGSVRENVCLTDRPDPRSAEAVASLVSTVGLAERIERLPGGLEAPVGRLFEGGQQLSGGEWQRLALARSLLRNTPVLILDEPAASLDPEGGRLLLDAVRATGPDRALVVITHHLQLIPDDARVAVLCEGRVVEQGYADELRRADGLYARLHAAQQAEAMILPSTGLVSRISM